MWDSGMVGICCFWFAHHAPQINRRFLPISAIAEANVQNQANCLCDQPKHAMWTIAASQGTPSLGRWSFSFRLSASVTCHSGTPHGLHTSDSGATAIPQGRIPRIPIRASLASANLLGRLSMAPSSTSPFRQTRKEYLRKFLYVSAQACRASCLSKFSRQNPLRKSCQK